jgi:alpha-beta hydrolase superfamily lysophospholipase
MSVFAKAWFWCLDYLYAGFWQIRGALSANDELKYREGQGQPVVLLPGIYETWEFLRPLARRLNADGHPVHVVTDLGRNRTSVAAAAETVLQLLGARELVDVIIVAHSKGGLIGKYLMMSAVATGRVDRMVAVAAPFAGSSLARYALLPTLRAFSPTDATILLLAADLNVNARITSIYPAFDPHIPGGSELPGATNVPLPIVGHFRIIGDPQLLDAVSAACAPSPA